MAPVTLSPDCGQQVMASGVSTSCNTAASPVWIAAKYRSIVSRR